MKIKYLETMIGKPNERFLNVRVELDEYDDPVLERGVRDCGVFSSRVEYERWRDARNDLELRVDHALRDLIGRELGAVTRVKDEA